MKQATTQRPERLADFSDGKAALKTMPAQTCYVCHYDIRKLDQSPVVHMPFASGDCTTCHNPHLSNRTAMIRKPLAEICFSCHDAELKDSHPVARHPTSRETKTDPRRAGKPFNCASCHNPHAEKNPKLLRLAEFSTLCEECHNK